MKFKKSLRRNKEMFRLKKEKTVVNIVAALDYQKILNINW